MQLGLNQKYLLIILVKAHKMKYFDNLPQKSFETTIGSFVISDFFTYLDATSSNFVTNDVIVDKKSTLLEISHLLYSDPNSFWSLVTANNTINPFTLSNVNTEIFEIEYQDKINLQLSGNSLGTTGYVFPAGSIIAPFKSNTGGSYNYTSVGNFDLNGPLSVIESVSYYDGNMIIKDQTGATYSFITPSGSTLSVVIMYPVQGGTYAIEKPYFTTNTKKALDTIVRTKKPSEGKVEISEEKSIYIKEWQEIPAPMIKDGTEITLLTQVEQTNKNIKSYSSSDLGALRSYFVTTKYN